MSILCACKRLENLHSATASAQYDVANRSTQEPVNPNGQLGAHAHSRANLLVHGLQTRRNIDCVAMGGVVEIAPPAEVSDDGRAGMGANTRLSEENALFPPALTKRLGITIELKCARGGSSGVVRLLTWRAKQHVQRVSDNFSDGPGFLFNSARNGNVTAQIFWLKTRARWKEAPSEHHVKASLAHCDVRDLNTETLQRIVQGQPVNWSDPDIFIHRSPRHRYDHLPPPVSADE
jgi:hypothetical protein